MSLASPHLFCHPTDERPNRETFCNLFVSTVVCMSLEFWVSPMFFVLMEAPVCALFLTLFSFPVEFINLSLGRELS